MGPPSIQFPASLRPSGRVTPIAAPCRVTREDLRFSAKEQQATQAFATCRSQKTAGEHTVECRVAEIVSEGVCQMSSDPVAGEHSGHPVLRNERGSQGSWHSAPISILLALLQCPWLANTSPGVRHNDLYLSSIPGPFKKSRPRQVYCTNISGPETVQKTSGQD